LSPAISTCRFQWVTINPAPTLSASVPDLIEPQDHSFEADTEGLVMRDLSDTSARIDIRYVSGYQLVPPRIRVFIDGERAGELEATDQRAQPFLVNPGSHSVSLKYRFWRSEARDVNLCAGEKATLRSGFQREAKPRFLFATAVAVGANPISLAGFPFAALAVTGFAGVLMADAYWRELTTPGSWLYLRPQAEGPLAESPPASVMRRSAMTIQRLMFLIAVTAVLLSVGVQERNSQRRTEMKFKQDLYHQQAKWHADDESRARKSEADFAELEARSREYVETLSKLINAKSEANSKLGEAQRALDELPTVKSRPENLADPAAQAKLADLESSCLKNIDSLSRMAGSQLERDALETKLRQEQRSLVAAKNMRATFGQSAASAAQSKQKYLTAAEHPMEPVKDDAPAP